MIEEKFVSFGFTMDERISKEVALEFVAVKQMMIAIFATLEPHKRQSIVNSLSKVSSPQMQDIVKNLKLLPNE